GLLRPQLTPPPMGATMNCEVGSHKLISTRGAKPATYSLNSKGVTRHRNFTDIVHGSGGVRRIPPWISAAQVRRRGAHQVGRRGRPTDHRGSCERGRGEET